MARDSGGSLRVQRPWPISSGEERELMFAVSTNYSLNILTRKDQIKGYRGLPNILCVPCVPIMYRTSSGSCRPS